MKQSPKIDFVITWVDGADPHWQREKSEHTPQALKTDSKDERYRDWELLKYWFRGVETFAPWVNNIYFVTYGHLPAFLNTNHPKLKIVKHSDFIPEKFLPTFNSNAIEMHLHRIPGLSYNFVYFNDDFFIVKPINPTDFFKDDLPCDMLAFQPVVANESNPVMSHIYLNNSLVFAKYFKKRENVKEHPKNYFKPGYPPLYFFYNLLELAFPRFTGLYTVHGPSALQKATFEELWRLEEEQLVQTSSNKFRSADDISIYLFREWQKLSNKFIPTNVHKDLAYFDVSEDNTALVRAIAKQKRKFICINDANKTIDFEGAKSELKIAFDKILPQKSSFEI